MVEPRIALVTGASRGVGRGIAVALGAAGWTVYLTSRGGVGADDPLGRVAAEVTTAGGTARPVTCDHADDDAVAALFERIEADGDRLDLLVNNVWAAPRGFGGFTDRFFERPLSDWDPLMDIGVRAQYVASWHAAQLMVPRESGLIATISSFGSRGHLHSVLYGMSKTALDKMTYDMAHELAGTGVSAVSLWPGIVRTELLLSAGIDSYAGFSVARAEDPTFIGRVIHALATDPDIGARSGATLVSAEVGAGYGISNDDGVVPDSHRAAFGGGGFFGPAR